MRRVPLHDLAKKFRWISAMAGKIRACCLYLIKVINEGSEKLPAYQEFRPTNGAH